MNENGESLPPPDDDRTPTQEDAPPPKRADGWVMPEPIFRKSTGYLPKGVAERFRQAQGDADVEESANSGDSVGEPPHAQPASAEITAQPEVADKPGSAVQAESVTPAPKKKGGFFRILLIIIGLLLAAGVVVAIVAAAVIWYFFQTSESQNFN
jgi:hypothetical protein